LPGAGARCHSYSGTAARTESSGKLRSTRPQPAFVIEIALRLLTAFLIPIVNVFFPMVLIASCA
jgi:hypothetical protein